MNNKVYILVHDQNILLKNFICNDISAMIQNRSSFITTCRLFLMIISKPYLYISQNLVNMNSLRKPQFIYKKIQLIKCMILATYQKSFPSVSPAKTDKYVTNNKHGQAKESGLYISQFTMNSSRINREFTADSRELTQILQTQTSQYKLSQKSILQSTVIVTYDIVLKKYDIIRTGQKYQSLYPQQEINTVCLFLTNSFKSNTFYYLQ
eukprot:TRINITY_DN4318_c1_g1_i15.p1 TRINITY_DN4318_c1_g1~~TRINITY_DN4318_c1_g1_i15.p1  ORF type:complete len:208 (+),score=-20.02 TRINITY_DN4318_c1_g1_i15:1383-2006(+)